MSNKATSMLRWLGVLSSALILIQGFLLCYRLVIHYREVRNELSELQSSKSQKKTSAPAPISGIRLDGESDQIRFPSTKPLIIILAVRGNRDCELTWTWWKRIATEVGKTADLEIIDVHDTFDINYAKQYDLDSSSVLLASRQISRNAARMAIPTVMLYARSGTILRKWSGVFTEQRYKDLMLTMGEAAD